VVWRTSVDGVVGGVEASLRVADVADKPQDDVVAGADVDLRRALSVAESNQFR